MPGTSAPIATIGGIAIGMGEAMLVAAGLASVLLVVVAVYLVAVNRRHREQAREAARRATEIENRLAEMIGRLHAVAENTASRDAHLVRTLDQRLDQVSVRLGQSLHDTARRTGDSLRQLHERLAVIDSAQSNIAALSNRMVSLQQILANKQARGAFGQARMEAIVADGLPATAYSFQHTLSNGTRPDCLIRLPDSRTGIVIDAKFPLEAFTAHREAADPAERKQAAHQLRTDISRHIADVSQKYLIAGETHEPAILFVPSESIYADLYELYPDIIQKAYRSRVVIVSPNMLMLTVQCMQTVFRDAAMREQAGLIKVEVERMMDDVHRLRDRVL